MSSIPNFPQVFLTEIFADLDAGLKTGVTVITPNRRLAAALKREFNESRVAKEYPPGIRRIFCPFPHSSNVSMRTRFTQGQASHLPILLTPAQEQVLWEDAITRSATGAALLSAAGAARLAREAWELAHAWRLIPRLRRFPLNEDGKAFQEWSRYYEKMTGRARQIDSARLCDLVSELCESPEVSKPKQLVCYGFDIVTPQQAALLVRLEEAGCEVMVAPTPSQSSSQPMLRPESENRNVQRVVYDDDNEEIRCAAVWARARIEANGSARIGIVVPGFTEYRSTIMRIFESVMEPDVSDRCPVAARRILPFNASLGMALISYPLVNAAFLILELGGGRD